MTAADSSEIGEDVLVLEIAEDVLRPFEQPDEAGGLPEGMPYYRAFLVPAEIANQYPREREEVMHGEAGAEDRQGG